LLNETRENPVCKIGELSAKSKTCLAAVESFLITLQEENVVTLTGEEIHIKPEQRMRIAELAISKGADPERVARALEWQEFEDLISGLPRKIVRWIGTHHPDNQTRKRFFRATGVQIGEGVVLNPNLIIQDSYNPLVKIGERVSIGPGVMIIADSAPNNSLPVDLGGGRRKNSRQIRL
jgi:acetyltransferase-like isoleucine patch superfamily enzyme